MKTNCDRSAGSPSEIIRRHAATLRGADAQVPCAGCTACCYHARIPVDPKQERPASLRLLDLVADTNGHRLLLRKRADGACVHLGPDGCTVYEHRPRACRGYDCRAVVIFGPGFTRYDATHYAPAWTTTSSSKPSSSSCAITESSKVAAALKAVIGCCVTRRPFPSQTLFASSTDRLR